MKKKEAEVWKHAGGGCFLSGGSHSCDDTYVNTKTKEEITVLSTTKAHFAMPEKVKSISKLLKLKGVKLSKE